MKFHLKLVLALAVSIGLVLSSENASSKAPVWKVTKGEDFLYLGGTIHVLSAKDYPLPEAFELAYKTAEDIVFETDLKALEAPEVQEQLLNAMSYRDHRALSNVLDRGTYDKLDALLKSKGLPIAVFDSFTPAGAMMALTQYELQKLGLIGGEGVDMHFGRRAVGDGKDSVFLESFEEQLSFIRSMNNLDANLVVKSGIRDLNNLESYWAELLNAWRTGDLEQLEDIGIDEMKRDFPSLYQTILVRRNDNWFSEIENMILSEEVEFVLVGALHMAGEEGLVSRLKAAGYEVYQLD